MRYKCMTSGSPRYRIRRFNGKRKSITIKVNRAMNILNLEEVVDAICEGFRSFKKG